MHATHRRKKGKYKTRMPMLSKFDPHLATIKGWLATEPQLTALSITRRLMMINPTTFGDGQHSIVQRPLRRLRKQAQSFSLLPTSRCIVACAARPRPPASVASLAALAPHACDASLSQPSVRREYDPSLASAPSDSVPPPPIPPRAARPY